MHLILGFVFCSRSHQLEPLLKRIDGYVHRNAFNFYAVAHLSEGLNFCSRSQFISKGLVSKMSQNKWFMNIFDFNFGFNFLESLTFLARNILHSHHISFLDPYFLESHTPAQLLWLRTWSGQKYFRSRLPFGSLRVRSFHTPFRCLFTAFIFFFFCNPVGVAQWGPTGPIGCTSPSGLYTGPLWVRYKNPRRGFL